MTINRKQLPKKKGVKRVPIKTVLHKLVKKEIQAIARREKKTDSYVLYEIAYCFFGLEVSNEKVKVMPHQLGRYLKLVKGNRKLKRKVA